MKHVPNCKNLAQLSPQYVNYRKKHWRKVIIRRTNHISRIIKNRIFFLLNTWETVWSCQKALDYSDNVNIPNLPTFRNAVQLRLRNMSPRKVPEYADLQLELSRNSWGKSPYGRKEGDKFRGESPDCSSSYLNPGSIWGVTPSACFKSGDTTGISGLFPNNFVYLHWKPLSLECRNLKEDVKYLWFCMYFGWNGDQRKPSSSSKKLPSEKAAQWDGSTSSEPQSATIRAVLQGDCSWWGASREEVPLQPGPHWHRFWGDPATLCNIYNCTVFDPMKNYYSSLLHGRRGLPWATKSHYGDYSWPEDETKNLNHTWTMA